jgi:hypothetical protein
VFYLYFKRHVSAHTSQPSSGLLQELRYTIVCLKLWDLVTQLYPWNYEILLYSCMLEITRSRYTIACLKLRDLVIQLHASNYEISYYNMNMDIKCIWILSICILYCNTRSRNFKQTIVYVNFLNKPKDGLLAWAETCRLK